jgi:4-hydroxybenzoate polyprenyltransferase
MIASLPVFVIGLLLLFLTDYSFVGWAFTIVGAVGIVLTVIFGMFNNDLGKIDNDSYNTNFGKNYPKPDAE